MAAGDAADQVSRLTNGNASGSFQSFHSSISAFNIQSIVHISRNKCAYRWLVLVLHRQIRNINFSLQCCCFVVVVSMAAALVCKRKR